MISLKGNQIFFLIDFAVLTFEFMKTKTKFIKKAYDQVM